VKRAATRALGPPLLALAAAVGCACPGGAAVTVETADAPVQLCAEVARTEAERMRGLRGRAPLAPGEALLLEFPVEDEICIVNDGVSFPIDVLYAASDDTVVAVERDVPAGDSTPRCHRGVQRVLETAAGALRSVGPGDRLRR
jgi:hypothetical protein